MIHAACESIPLGAWSARECEERHRLHRIPRRWRHQRRNPVRDFADCARAKIVRLENATIGLAMRGSTVDWLRSVLPAQRVID
jgi:hypothetical protein